MQKLIIAVCCLLSTAALVRSAEPKPLTEKEVEKELALIQAYLARDPATLPKDAKNDERRAAHDASVNVVTHVGSLPEDSPVRLKAIALARKYAAVSDYPNSRELSKKNPDSNHYLIDVRAHTALDFAWGVLRETKVLHDGLRLKDLVGLLGQPTNTTPEMAEWWYRSQMHVNPRLQFWRKDGRLKKGAILLSHD